MDGTSREAENGQRQSSEIDRLMESLGADVNISNPQDDGSHSTTKPANASSLTVSPPPRDNAAFFSMQPSQMQRGQMSQQGFLTSPPPFDMSIFMPSPTALWINALPVDHPVTQATQQSVDSLSNPNSTSSLTTNVNSAQSTPFEQLPSHSDSDLLDSSPEYPWFPQDTSTAMSSYTDPLLLLLNLSPVATKPGDRTLPVVDENDTTSMPSHSHGKSPRRSRSPSPSRFGDVSPFTSPLTSTPNSPFSSEGGFFSDGGGDDAVMGAALSASSSKRKTPDRALNESEEIQSPGDGPSPKKQ